MDEIAPLTKSTRNRRPYSPWHIDEYQVEEQFAVLLDFLPHTFVPGISKKQNADTRKTNTGEIHRSKNHNWSPSLMNGFTMAHSIDANIAYSSPFFMVVESNFVKSAAKIRLSFDKCLTPLL